MEQAWNRYSQHQDSRVFQLYLKHLDFQLNTVGDHVDFVAAHQFANHALDCFDAYEQHQQEAITYDRIRSFGRSVS